MVWAWGEYAPLSIKLSIFGVKAAKRASGRRPSILMMMCFSSGSDVEITVAGSVAVGWLVAVGKGVNVGDGVSVAVGATGDGVDVGVAVSKIIGVGVKVGSGVRIDSTESGVGLGISCEAKYSKTTGVAVAF